MPQVPNNNSNNDDGLVHFRSLIASLSVVVGDPDPTKGEVAHPTESFTPYWEEKKGVEGRFKVGYLATSNGSAIKKLSNDPNVQKISKQDYEDATKPVYDASGIQINGERAPY